LITFSTYLTYHSNVKTWFLTLNKCKKCTVKHSFAVDIPLVVVVSVVGVVVAVVVFSLAVDMFV